MQLNCCDEHRTDMRIAKASKNEATSVANRLLLMYPGIRNHFSRRIPPSSSAQLRRRFPESSRDANSESKSQAQVSYMEN